LIDTTILHNRLKSLISFSVSLLDDALAAAQMALRLFVAGLAEAAKKPILSSLVSQSSAAANSDISAMTSTP
jgi:hypothetical protein